MNETANTSWADSKETWFGRVHDAVLPSGMKVTYRDLSLGELIELGELPDDLLEVAVAEWAEPGGAKQLAMVPFAELPEKPTKKQTAEAESKSVAVLRGITAVNRLMIARAVVAPEITVEELETERIPYVDIELLSALINRRTVTDAAGRHVGVVPIDQFQIVLAAHGHEPCPEDCEACTASRRQLATVR